MRVSFVTLAVADVARATAFYRRLLEAEPTRTGAGHAFFEADGQTLALFDQEAMARETGTSGRPGAVGLSWNLPDEEALAAALARAEAAGATVTHPLHTQPWGARACWVTDPDGHPWELVWNPRSHPPASPKAPGPR